MGRMSPVCLSPIQLFGVRSGYQNQASNRIQNHIVLLNTLSYHLIFTRAPELQLLVLHCGCFPSLPLCVSHGTTLLITLARSLSVVHRDLTSLALMNCCCSWPLPVLPRLLASVRTWSGPEVKLLRSRQLLTNILQVLSTLACPKKFN